MTKIANTENTSISQYEADKTNIEQFLSSNTTEPKKFDYAAFKRLVISELAHNKCFDETRVTCLGFTRHKIAQMMEHPEKYGKQILRLSNYMYLKSGYYKRLIDYFANQAVLNYTVDTKIKTPKMLSVTTKTLSQNYISFVAQAEKFNLSSEINNILKRMFKNDVVYAFVTENDYDISYYYLDPMICGINSLVNGNVYEYYIDKSKINKKIFETFPVELQDLVLAWDNTQEESNSKNKCICDKYKIPIPYKNSLCLKYNNDFIYPYPPFLMMIADILLIDEYKDLAKAQSINDAYKILTMKIPTKDGEITLDDGLISTFTSIVLETVQNNIGVITTPFDVQSEEFSSSNADDRDTVSDAISWAFKNVGVSEALMSGASSGSELKLSITNDSGDIFRIYRMIENWMSLQMKLRNHIYKDYEFVYNIMDMTIFNSDDIKKTELQMAQNGLPNKFKLGAANGMSPAVLLGNSIAENQAFKDIFDNWQVLKTSYTQSSNDSGGRPTKEDGDLAPSTETQRGNDSNSTENRI